MKLITYDDGTGEPHIGVYLDAGKSILALQQAYIAKHAKPLPAFASMLDLIRGGDETLTVARDLVAAADAGATRAADAVTILAPLPIPEQIRDCLCFEEHLLQAYNVLRKRRAATQPDPDAALAQMEKDGAFSIPEVWYQYPIYYKGNRFSVSGPDTDIIWPSFAEVMDFELEFAVVIGTPGKDIARDDAMRHVFGYTVFNDFTARDFQTVEMPGGLGPAKSKDFDTGNAIGPCIVTADEIDPYNLTMVARVNGEEWSRGSSSTMHWKFEDLIHHISKSETLQPGEILGSGTVGSGSGLEQERYLNPGDIVELDIDGIGVLRNRLVRPS